MRLSVNVFVIDGLSLYDLEQLDPRPPTLPFVNSEQVITISWFLYLTHLHVPQLCMFALFQTGRWSSLGLFQFPCPAFSPWLYFPTDTLGIPVTAPVGSKI